MTSNYYSIKSKTITNDVDTIEAGFLSATLINLGTVNATLTQQTNSITILPKGTFVIPYISSKIVWDILTIDATETTVECAYF